MGSARKKSSALGQAAFIVGMTVLAVLFALIYLKAADNLGELISVALLPAL